MARRRPADWADAPWFYRFLKTYFHYPVKWACRVHAKGKEHVPPEGGVILVSNHLSWADPVVLQDVLDRPGYYLAKESVFSNRFNRWFMEGMGMIKVDRQTGGNEDAVRTAVAALERGRVVGVYPESTRAVFPRLLPFKTGAARVALLSGAPLVPVGVLTDRFWGKGASVPRFGRRVYVNIGEAVHVDKDAKRAEDRDHVRKITEELQRRVEGLLLEAARARDRGERWRWR